MCLFVRVTVVDKNKAVVCCLLATSGIMLSKKKKWKRKMWSKKWYLERNISCDVHLLNELLETDVEDCINCLVLAGKLRKLWDSKWTAQFSAWKTTGKDRSQVGKNACQNCAVYSVFCQVWSHTVISLSLTGSVQRPTVSLVFTNANKLGNIAIIIYIIVCMSTECQLTVFYDM